MKIPHLSSFVLGLASGLLMLILIVGGMRLTGASHSGGSSTSTGGPNIARMAQRLGLTQDQLNQELASGKTFQQIAQEHGVQFTGRGRSVANGLADSGQSSTGTMSGAAVPSTTQSSSSQSSAS